MKDTHSTVAFWPFTFPWCLTVRHGIDGILVKYSYAKMAKNNLIIHISNCETQKHSPVSQKLAYCQLIFSSCPWLWHHHLTGREMRQEKAEWGTKKKHQSELITVIILILQVLHKHLNTLAKSLPEAYRTNQDAEIQPSPAWPSTSSGFSFSAQTTSLAEIASLPWPGLPPDKANQDSRFQATLEPECHGTLAQK